VPGRDSRLKYFFSPDLAEVVSVAPPAPTPGVPKKTDEKFFFDVSKLNFPTGFNFYRIVEETPKSHFHTS